MTLTRETAKMWLPIIQAFIDGKTIQAFMGYDAECKKIYADMDTSETLPLTHMNHSEVDPEFEYRIKEDKND